MIELISKKEFNTYNIKIDNVIFKEELENIEFEDLLKIENPENFETRMISNINWPIIYNATYIESIKSWIVICFSHTSYLKSILKFESNRIFKIYK